MPTDSSHSFQGAYAGRRVLVTGHTGFKGAWLSHWLLELGANVTGFALPPEDTSLFRQLGIESRITHRVGDVTNAAEVARVVDEARPDFVFHLAAQALVRTSYEIPVATYSTNVMGTAHVLEALRLAGRPVSVVVVTTDKCYANREWVHSYREDDELGGFDPYSSSKAAAELVVAAYRQSFFASAAAGDLIRVATARAGNVIGGGDWSRDRIVPDCVRALSKAEPIQVRNRFATRPWQHVLDPLSGYLWLGARLSRAADRSEVSTLASAYNFGPGQESNRNVAQLVAEVLKYWPGSWTDLSDPNAPHEAQRLNLSTEKSYHVLGWRGAWDFSASVAATVEWYRHADRHAGEIHNITTQQLRQFTANAAAAGLLWAPPMERAQPGALRCARPAA